MKLNYDCIRDVLLLAERELIFTEKEDGFLESSYLHISGICKALPQYSKADLVYTIHMLDEAGFLRAEIQWATGGIYDCYLLQMTYYGHQFLERVRDDQRWSKVKAAAAAIKDYSLAAISSFAEGITAGAIETLLAKKL